MSNHTEFTLPDSIALLKHGPAAFDALLRGLPDVWMNRNEGPGTWSATDILAHLVFIEKTDWMPRVRFLLEHEEAQPFEPVDRTAGLKQSAGKSVPQLLTDFTCLRNENLIALEALDLHAGDLARAGRHPALGVVRLSELIATWTVHDLTHLHQLSRVLARHYEHAVGPWSPYLGVLQCTGHSGS